MKNFTNAVYRVAFTAICVALMFGTNTASFSQTAPDLGTAATYGAFSGAGAIENTGITTVNGDIGTNAGAFTGFPPGIYTGAYHNADAASLKAKDDLVLGYNSMNDAIHAIMFDTAIGATMGNGQVLTSRTYGREDLTTIEGDLTFDAKGNPDAIFIIKIRAALNVAKNTKIILAGGARSKNIYWAVDGAVSVLDNSVFKGTIVANGAIHFYGGSELDGRALSIVGAVTLASNYVTGLQVAPPGNSLTIVTPAAGDSVKGGKQGYQIKWTGVGIDYSKTIEYSLDSGTTWKNIAVISTSDLTYLWNVPDTVSTKARVRVTDGAFLRGTSGIFKITAMDKLTITNPAQGDSVMGGTVAYQIKWTGSGIAASKTIEYSLDSGATWKSIAVISSALFAYSWNVPDTVSTKARIRITDANSLRGISGVFKITAMNKIVIVSPKSGDSIQGNTANYQIKWTGSGIAASKTIEYSLDSGATWKTIAVINSALFAYSWKVPDTVSTKARIRITDANTLRGTSGIFKITASGKMTILNPAAGESIVGGTLGYQVKWSGTAIAALKTIEYSLDSGATWKPVAVITSPLMVYSWNVPDTVSTKARLRITDGNGLRAVSGVFTITTSKVPGTIRFVRPFAGEILIGGTQGYAIMWSATGLTRTKTLEYSLDSGRTWTIIVTMSNDTVGYAWNVPDMPTTTAMLRLTDSSGATGKSAVFTIKSSSSNTGSIVILHPAAGEVLAGGSVNYPITFTAVNTTLNKRFEYSLNAGATWTLIENFSGDIKYYVWSNVPNEATTTALIRITDDNGISGVSGLFTIDVVDAGGSIDGLVLSGLDINRNIAVGGTIGISWTFTPDIGTSVEVEYSLDASGVWYHIATLPVTESPFTSWTTPNDGPHNPAFIRVRSTRGMVRVSSPFTIGSPTSVSDAQAAAGYNVSSYPNPAFNNAQIAFAIPVATDVLLTIVDARGVEVGTTVQQRYEAGSYSIPVNTTSLAAGMYAYTLQAGPTRLVGTLIITK
ncbi:hypothetical protein BH10BAC6_BH10BAC6_16380 [soil metagenome]